MDGYYVWNNTRKTNIQTYTHALLSNHSVCPIQKFIPQNKYVQKSHFHKSLVMEVIFYQRKLVSKRVYYCIDEKEIRLLKKKLNNTCHGYIYVYGYMAFMGPIEIDFDFWNILKTCPPWTMDVLKWYVSIPMVIVEWILRACFQGFRMFPFNLSSRIGP